MHSVRAAVLKAASGAQAPLHAWKSAQSRPNLWQLLEVLIKKVDAVIKQVRQELQVDAAASLLLRQLFPLSPAASEIPSNSSRHLHLPEHCS